MSQQTELKQTVSNILRNLVKNGGGYDYMNPCDGGSLMSDGELYDLLFQHLTESDVKKIVGNKLYNQKGSKEDVLLHLIIGDE